MRNPFTKDTLLVRGSQLLGVVHAVAMVLPEAVVRTEVAFVRSLTKKYDAQEIMDARYMRTGKIHDKVSELPSMAYRRARSIVKKEPSAPVRQPMTSSL